MLVIKNGQGVYKLLARFCLWCLHMNAIKLGYFIWAIHGNV